MTTIADLITQARTLPAEAFVAGIDSCGVIQLHPVNQSPTRTLVAQVEMCAATVFGITLEQMRSRCRTRAMADARSAMCLVLYKRGMTVPDIQRRWSHRRLCGIQYELNRARKLFKFDAEFREKAERVMRAISEPA